MNKKTAANTQQTPQAYYLTALVYHGEEQDNQFKYVEKYNSYNQAKKQLKRIVTEKRKQKWDVKADFKSRPAGQGNIDYMVTGHDSASTDKVHWLLSCGETATMADGNDFSEFNDVTPKRTKQKQTEYRNEPAVKKLIAKLLMVLKMSPIVTIAISFVLFWIFFV
ncbi:hypothetical protein [Psychromonas aquimarina]|uniref:hypothetical protein n=1 Tax=Psychromonas aquimarina TaxID=444919 RepID=UPI000409964C|nr:hypothetical protein [Psychromonas aquimarina]